MGVMGEFSPRFIKHGADPEQPMAHRAFFTHLLERLLFAALTR